MLNINATQPATISGSSIYMNSNLANITGNKSLHINSLSSLLNTSQVSQSSSIFKNLASITFPIKSSWYDYDYITSKGSSSVYNQDDINLAGYIWKHILDIIPSSELNEKINYYETKYKIPTEEFYQQWISGRFEDTPDSNDWISLYLQLKDINK